jgi:glycosyltransferase involved in cell wall biosynthesis
MKILMVHNYYRQRGGEDISFEAEASLLESKGHKVLRYTKDNNGTKNMNYFSLISKIIWNKEVYSELRKIIKKEKPDIVHFQNTFAIISPSAYYAAKAEGIPVVKSVRNYRLFCPSSTGFFRKGKICENCLGKAIPWSGIVHSCYRSSRLASAALVTILIFHRFMRTLKRKVDVYIANTEFSKKKFVQGGLSSKKILVKPNFFELDSNKTSSRGDYAVFVGRLSNEKGLFTLLEAWKNLRHIPLKIVGDGPLLDKVNDFVKDNALGNVEIKGYKSEKKVSDLIEKARFLIFPSEWYETFGRVIVEAFAYGIPVIASRLGAMAEIIKDKQTGLQFTPGSSKDLAAKVEWAWTHKKEMKDISKKARKDFENKYTSEKNYEQLIKIYKLAIANNSRK